MTGNARQSVKVKATLIETDFLLLSLKITYGVHTHRTAGHCRNSDNAQLTGIAEKVNGAYRVWPDKRVAIEKTAFQTH